MIVTDLNESYILVKEEDITILNNLKKVCSCFAPNYQFQPKFRMQLWDGRINFFQKTFDHDIIKIPKGLKNHIIKFAKKFDIEIEYNKDEYENITEEQLNEFIKTLNIPFEPYDYQKRCVLESLNKGRLINVAATSSGKSLMIYMICRYMLANNKNTFIIVPNIMLVNQIFQDFIDYGFKDAEKYVQRIGGTHKIKTIEKPICISTWQSQYRNAEGYDNIDCLIIDECQSVKGNESLLGTLIIPACYNARYRFGFTGTLPHSISERMSIMSCLGPKNPVINAQGLVEAGLATPIEIKVIYLNYNENEAKEIHKYKDYFKEEKYIHEHTRRNLIVCKIIEKISKSGNTLALYTKIAHGDLLLENIIKERSSDTDFIIIKKITPTSLKGLENKKIFTRHTLTDKDKKTIQKEGLDLNNFKSIEDLNIFVVDGSVEEKNREYVRQILESHNNAIILATLKCMSTGVNIRKLHNLVLCSTTKSEITLLQSIGRLMRLHDTKDKAVIYDIVDSALTKRGKENYFYKHFKERLAEYLDSGFPISEKEINI